MRRAAALLLVMVLGWQGFALAQQPASGHGMVIVVSYDPSPYPAPASYPPQALYPNQAGHPHHAPAPLVSPEPCCEKSCGGHRTYFEFEYLMWWMRDMRTPPLLVSDPSGATPVYGQPGSVVVYGDTRIETPRHKIDGRHFGPRITLGWWFDDCQTIGVELRAWFLERDSFNDTIDSPGSAFAIARPYIDAQTGQGASEVVAGPVPGEPDRTGSINFFGKIELFGEEANLVYNLKRCDWYRLDLLAGLHFLQMREQFNIINVSFELPDELILHGVEDRFRTRNRFYGAQLGLRGGCMYGRWFCNARAEGAFGLNHRFIKTYGTRIFQTPMVRIEDPWGLYVLPTNRGDFDDMHPDFMFELGLNIGCCITDHIRVFAGYTVLYWLNPIRPGDQIDLNLNPDQIATGVASVPTQPQIRFEDDFFWASGANAGLEISW